MARSKRPRKAYKPKNFGETKISLTSLLAFFTPLESILDQLEKEGTKDVADGGIAVFKDYNDREHWYETRTALEGVYDFFRLHEERNGLSLDVEPLKQLANKLHYDMPIEQSDIDRCRTCFKMVREQCSQMTSQYARDLIKTIQIKEEFERVCNEH